MPQRVKRTRGGGRYTDAEVMGRIRSALRRAFRYWPVAMDAKLRARRPNSDPKSKRRWDYQCAHCKQWWADKEVEVDHINPAGSLKSFADISGWVERLIPENIDAFQVLCKPCHKEKTNKERKGRKK